MNLIHVFQAGFTTLFVPEGLDTVPGTVIAQQASEAIYGPPPAGINHYYTNTPEITTYITTGAGEAITYTPYFTYMGQRYIQLTGFALTCWLNICYNQLCKNFIL
jgi:hypothetical protein